MLLSDLMEVLGLWDRIVDPNTGEGIGWKPISEDDACYCAPPTGGCRNPGVSMILWHVAWDDEEQKNDLPFVIEAFTRIKFDAGSISRTRNAEFNGYEVTGRAIKNENWGRGPGNLYPEAAGLTVESGEWNSDVEPPNGCSCDACGYAAAPDFVGAP